MEVFLKDPDATNHLGRELAKALARTRPIPALMLQGGLGAGKTALVRGLVECLPGADQAEVSSPSFNIFNLYPTTPQVAHFDLYRLEGMPPDEALFEYLSDSSTLVAVEWPEYLERSMWPQHGLHIEFTPSGTGRRAEISALEGTNKIILDIISELAMNIGEVGP